MYVYDEEQHKWIPHRATAEYKQKKKIVRDMWIVMGILMTTSPVALAMGLALLTTFLSFTVLDESIYRQAVRP
ncbi:MAG: hypothetical protein PVF34_07590 [Gammaproteobacteria bacterium]|jgi:hypothetical protein